MSYLHIGKNVMVSRRRIIGVFGLDITSQSPRTREFLERAEKDGVVLDADIASRSLALERLSYI